MYSSFMNAQRLISSNVCCAYQLTILWATSANTEDKYLGGLDWNDRGKEAQMFD